MNYIRTPLRFTLTLSDMSLIGKRRAAQRLAAGALSEVKEGASEEDITNISPMPNTTMGWQCWRKFFRLLKIKF